MKKLVLGSLLLFVVTQATGCIIASDDEPDLATIRADWSIRTIAGTNAGCPPGFNTVALYSQLLDSRDQPIGQPDIDLFDCALGTGLSAPLEPGVYQSWIEILDCPELAACPGSRPVYAESTSAIVDVTTSDKAFTAAIFVDGGYFSLSWRLQGKASNQSLECSQVTGLDSVEILSTVTNGSAASNFKFDCEPHFGVSQGLLQGSYTVSVSALDRSNLALGVAPALANKLIASPNRVTDLGDVIIPIDGQ